jgi:hypothetical protein
MIGNKQLGKVICIACNEIFADHSKRQLIRCMFRIQGTLVGNGVDNTDLPSMVPNVDETG